MATNVTVFSETTRTDQVYTSPSVSYDGGSLSVFYQLSSSAWSGFTGTVMVEPQWSFDSGATWEDAVAPNTFQGGVFGKGGSLPSGSFTAGDNLGTRLVRVLMTPSGTGAGLDLGLNASINAIV